MSWIGLAAPFGHDLIVPSRMMHSIALPAGPCRAPSYPALSRIFACHYTDTMTARTLDLFSFGISERGGGGVTNTRRIP